MSPPLNVSDVIPYFGDVKKFPQVAKLLRVVQHGVPAETKQSQADFKKALEYGNHRAIQDHLQQIMGKTSGRCTEEQGPSFHKESSSRRVFLRPPPPLPMPATVSKPIPRLFSLIFFFVADPTYSCGCYCKYKSITIFFSISPSVAVNILYFLVRVIDSLGGGAIVETLRIGRRQSRPPRSRGH